MKKYFNNLAKAIIFICVMTILYPILVLILLISGLMGEDVEGTVEFGD